MKIFISLFLCAVCLAGCVSLNNNKCSKCLTDFECETFCNK